MSVPRPVAVVVGAGVSGLTCAVRLLECGARFCCLVASPLQPDRLDASRPGWDVHVVAKERPEETVSLGAGAIWEFPPVRRGWRHGLRCPSCHEAP